MYGITSYKKNNYDPFKEFRALQKAWFNDEANASIKTDIRDTGDTYVIDAELPGYKKEEINVDVKDDILTISAEKHTETNEEEKNGYIRRERYYGSVSRSDAYSPEEEGRDTAEPQNRNLLTHKKITPHRRGDFFILFAFPLGESVTK